MTDREQKLVDLCFEFAIKAKDGMVGKTNEEVADWVAKNLRSADFDTRPVGLSWGVLCRFS